MPTFQRTPEQEAIVAFIADNPNTSLMVDARAGSAKTTTIVDASQGINPKVTTALAVAFNKRIAEELGKKLPEGFATSTLNSLGHRAWASAIGGRRLTVDPDKMYKLARKMAEFSSDPDGERFTSALAMARSAKSAGLIPDGAPMRKRGLLPDNPSVWKQIAFDKSLAYDTPEVIDLARKLVLASIREAYNGLIDYDDQIFMSALFDGVFPKYHTVIVDEAQDLSALNHIQLQKATRVRLIAIGDPYQAIYAFRGADSESMNRLFETFEPERLGLTASFRVPHSVSARQLSHVPDFSSHHSVREGSIEVWREGWSLGSIPEIGAVLCRNNAPLMKLAYMLIRERRPVKVLGREIGGALSKLLSRIASKAGLSVCGPELALAIDAWRDEEIQKARDSESKQDTIRDRAESLQVLVEASESANVVGACTFITELFADRAGGLVLASGHKAKGLEWDWVLHLDPWRVPSKQALRANDHGNPAPLVQERNLKYVIETRTKDTLVVANLDQCKETN